MNHIRQGREAELHDAALACVTACVEAKHAGEHVPTEIQFAVSRLAMLFRASPEIAAEIKRNR